MNATELSELRRTIAEQHQAAAEHLDAANAMTQDAVGLLATEIEAERKARTKPIRCIFCEHESSTLAELREHSATCEKHPAVIVLRESIGPVTPTKDTPEGYTATVRHHPSLKTLEVEFTTPSGGFVCFMEHLPELHLEALAREKKIEEQWLSLVTANAELGAATVEALVKVKAGERLAAQVEQLGTATRCEQYGVSTFLFDALNEYKVACDTSDCGKILAADKPA